LIDHFYDEKIKGNGKIPSPKCRLSLGQNPPKISSTRRKTSEPVFQEGFLFLSKKPEEDKLVIQANIYYLVIKLIFSYQA